MPLKKRAGITEQPKLPDPTKAHTPAPTMLSGTLRPEIVSAEKQQQAEGRLPDTIRQYLNGEPYLRIKKPEMLSAVFARLEAAGGDVQKEQQVLDEFGTLILRKVAIQRKTQERLRQMKDDDRSAFWIAIVLTLFMVAISAIVALILVNPVYFGKLQEFYYSLGIGKVFGDHTTKEMWTTDDGERVAHYS